MKYLKCVFVVASFAIVLAFLKLRPSGKMLEVFFTIHGIVYSIAVSQIIGFNTSLVRNQQIRQEILSAISSTLKKLTIWFIISALAYILPSVLTKTFTIASLSFNLTTIAFPTILLSLGITVLTFISIRKLALKVEDAILDENQ
jgi:hypothetical protein